MESILIHPESNEQLRTVKAVLKALKVQFEAQVDHIDSTLPLWQKRMIDDRLEAIEKDPSRLNPISELMDELDK